MAEVISEPAPPEFRGRKVMLGGAIAAAIGLLVLVLGLVFDTERAFLSYLWAFVFAFTISVGGLLWLMIGYAANARWMSVVRRGMEVVALALPALAVLFVPILFGLGWLYPWHTPPPHLAHHELEVIHHREPYLNTPFFVIRAIVYFAILILASSLLRRWSVRRDRDERVAGGDPEAVLGRERAFASAMLPPVGLAFTFAMIDWVMTLQPVWFSSIFGIYMFAGGFLAAIALVTIFAERLVTLHRGAGVVTPEHFYALGRLLLAFTVFWSYAAFFQAMLIRIANKPEEVQFYLQRLEGGWEVFAWILVIGHFALPFLLLLPRAPKYRPRAMAGMACWLVLMHLVDTYWIVVPSHARGGGFLLHWVDLGALALVLGSCIAVAAWRQHRVALVAFRDPFLAEGARYRSPL